MPFKHMPQSLSIRLLCRAHPRSALALTGRHMSKSDRPALCNDGLQSELRCGEPWWWSEDSQQGWAWGLPPSLCIFLPRRLKYILLVNNGSLFCDWKDEAGAVTFSWLPGRAAESCPASVLRRPDQLRGFGCHYFSIDRNGNVNGSD